MVNGVEDDLHRLAGNLVENALIHTPSGTPVTVSVRRESGTAVLEVADRGPGVPPAIRERVFERFARGRRRRRAAAAAAGWGWRSFVRWPTPTAARSELGDAEGGGARFTVDPPGGGPAALRYPGSVLIAN